VSKHNGKQAAVPPASKAQAEDAIQAKVSKAKLALRPTINAAAVIECLGKDAFADLDVGTLAAVMGDTLKDIHGNDLQRCESMLFAQANALQTVFTAMTRRASAQTYLKQCQAFWAIALKAQNQCRMTLETLAMIKNPPVFARQANIAHGPQQVNNGTPPPAATPSRAENSQTAQSKLLEVTHGERLDTQTAGTAGATDPAMATLAPRDRPANG
jgi:hypothetical protein